MSTRRPTTHERYLHAVRDLVITHAQERDTITAAQAKRLAHTKLLYGVGDGTYRGVTVFDAWENGVGRVDDVEIAATGQESWIQQAGPDPHPGQWAAGAHGRPHRCRLGHLDREMRSVWLRRVARLPVFYSLGWVESRAPSAARPTAWAVAKCLAGAASVDFRPVVRSRPRW